MNKRQKYIVDELAKFGEIEIHDLAKKTKVSDMTIYRDVNYLEQKGLVFRKRGAVVYVEKTDVAKHDRYLQQKEAIALRAAALVREEDTIIFDNSTTALEVAKLLKDMKNITVYTTSIELASVFCKNRDITLYCSGGYYLHASTGFVGSWTEEFIDRIRASKCFIGASGISLEFGITGPYPQHSQLEQKIIKASQQVIMVADHSKLEKVAVEKIADLGQIDCLITDWGADESLVEQLQKQTHVIIAQEEGASKGLMEIEEETK